MFDHKHTCTVYMYISKFRNKERDMCPGLAGICTCITGLHSSCGDIDQCHNLSRETNS